MNPPLGAGTRHVADVGTEKESPEGSEEPDREQQPEKVVTLMEKLSAGEAGQLKQQWETLKAEVESLKHVETFSVVTIAYRRYAA